MHIATRRLAAPLFTAVALLASQSFAAGFYFGDNGARASTQGWAFAGEADDLSAMEYNPAGLAQLKGLHFNVEGLLLHHAVSFDRRNPGAPDAVVTKGPAENSVGVFPLPLAGVSYGFDILDRNFSVALGVFGPPASGRYAFNKPNYDRDPNDPKRWVADPRLYAPQRYTLIENNILIVYPTLSLAYAVHPRLMFGVSLQLVLSTIQMQQAIYSDIFTPPSIAMENAANDSLADVNVGSGPSFTAIFGMLIKPWDFISIGASLRPQIPINAKGKLKVTILPNSFAESLGTTTVGDDASLSLTLPFEWRVGLQVRPIDGLRLNADFVYQGWQSVTDITLTPINVGVSLMGGAPVPVDPFKIPKHWSYSISTRFGAAYDLIEMLTLHGGFMFETGAAPDQYTAVDFAHFDRVFLTGGVTAHLWKFDITAGFAGTPAVTKQVTNSEVRAGTAATPDPGQIVGNGVYTSGGYVISLGIGGHFLDAPTTEAPKDVPTEALPPAPESTPPPAK